MNSARTWTDLHLLIRLLLLTAVGVAFVLLDGASAQAAPPAFIVGDPSNATALSGDEDESAVAVNPRNTQQIAMMSNGVPGDNGLPLSISSDGGQTWTRTIFANGVTPAGAPLACCDPTLAWDEFGNLYVGYLYRLGGARSIELYVTTDLGVSYTNLGPVAVAPNVDQPTVVAAEGTVWVTWSDNGQVKARGRQVTGAGTFGAWAAPQNAPSATFGNFGDIVIGPGGKVLVTYQNPNSGEGPDTIFTNLDADGLGAGGFGASTPATTTNVGAFDRLPAQPQRSVDAEAGLAWDRSGGARNGRLYMVYNEETPNESNDFDVLVRTSDNDGTTWSAPVRVNDDAGTRSQLLPRISLDQVTGNIAVTFYDARDDDGSGPNAVDRDGTPNTDVMMYGTLSTDGGTTWSPNFVISDAPTDGYARNGLQELGDYTGAIFHDGVLYVSWADSSNSTGDNPDGAYSALDIYTAKLQVPIDPTVSAGGPYTTPQGTPVTLTATGSDPDGGFITYKWDLDNDGAFETTTDSPGATVSFPATVPGLQTVGVQVTDDEMVTATATTTVFVTAPPSVSAGGPYSTAQGAPVQLTATGSDPDGGLVLFRWDLDNDSVFETTTDSPGATVSFAATSAGSFTVNVQATDDENTTSTAQTTVQVTAPASSGTGSGFTGGTTPGGSSGDGNTGGPGPGPGPGPDVDETVRTDDPEQAAVTISRLRFGDAGGTFAQQLRQAAFVVLARVDVFADSLSGSVLTGSAPLLFTDRGALDAITATEIDRVLGGAGTVYLLGGTNALSEDVEASLTSAGYTTIRLAGQTRIETAIAVADAALGLPAAAPSQVAIARSNGVDGNPTAAWADAITAGSWAADTRQPILLNPTSTLHPAVAAWLADHPTLSPIALGGPSALAEAVVGDAGATRVAGANRYATAVAIADTLWTGPTTGNVIANGTADDAWALSLAAAGLGADLDRPTLLVDARRLPAETDVGLCGDGTRPDLTIIGSDALVSQEVRDQLAEPCPSDG